MAEFEVLNAGLEELRRRIEAHRQRLAQSEERWRSLGVPAPERMARLEQTDPLVAGVLRALATAGRAYEATGIPERLATGVERAAELAGQAGRSLAAGTGDVIRTAGGTARWLGAEGLGQRLERAGAALAERYGEEPTEEFSWRSLLSPRFWATTVMRTVPFTLSLIPAAIGGAYVGSRLGARLGAWGSSILSALGAAAASRPLESALEAGGAYQEALARGMSPEEAERAANEVFRRNLALMGLDAAEWAAAFMRVPPGVQRAVGRLGSRAVGRAAIAAGRMVGAALPEAGEEYVQEAIQRQALGEPHPWRFDPAMQEAAALGAIIGVGFGAAGSVYDYLRDATVRRLSPEQRQRYEQAVQQLTQSGLTQREAEVAALDQIAQTPEGARATTEAAQEVAAALAQQAQQAAPQAQAPAPEPAPAVTAPHPQAPQATAPAQPARRRRTRRTAAPTPPAQQATAEQPPAPAEAPQAPAPPAAQAPASVAVGSTVYHPATGEPLTVVDTSDPALFTVRNQRGATFQIGRRAVLLTPPQPTTEAPAQAPEQPRQETAPAQPEPAPTPAPQAAQATAPAPAAPEAPTQEAVQQAAPPIAERKPSAPPAFRVGDLVGHQVGFAEEIGRVVSVSDDRIGVQMRDSSLVTYLSARDPSLRKFEDGQPISPRRFPAQIWDFPHQNRLSVRVAEDAPSEITDALKAAGFRYLPRQEEWRASRKPEAIRVVTDLAHRYGLSLPDTLVPQEAPPAPPGSAEAVAPTTASGPVAEEAPPETPPAQEGEAPPSEPAPQAAEAQAAEPERTTTFAPGDRVTWTDARGNTLTGTVEWIGQDPHNPDGPPVLAVATDQIEVMAGGLPVARKDIIPINTPSLRKLGSAPRQEEQPAPTPPAREEAPQAPAAQEASQAQAPAPAASAEQRPAQEQQAPSQFPTLEWGPGKPDYIKTLPSHAEQRRFFAEAQEVGWIDQPYNHRQPVYWYRGRLVRLQSAAGAGISDRRAYLHAVDPEALGDAYHWRNNQAARNARMHWEAQRKARQAQAEQAQAAAQLGGVTIRENPERDGIEIRFDKKPSADILQMLHQAGFRWSKRQGLWYAKRSDKTRAAADEIRRRYGLGATEAPAAAEAAPQAAEQPATPAPAPAPETAAPAAQPPAPPESGARMEPEVTEGGAERGGPGHRGARAEEARPAGERVGDQGAPALARTPAEDVPATEEGGPAEGGRGGGGREHGRSPEQPDREGRGSVHGGGSGTGDVGAAPDREGSAEPRGGERPAELRPRNLRITQELADDLEPKGPKDKYRRNVAAIRLLKQIEAEGRPATPEEQAVLARFSGWGSLPQVFNPYNKEWAKEYQELRELLTPEEWEAARHSTANAHYSSPAEIRAMWDALLKMGFKGGRVLEPSAGVGHFLGFVPHEVAGETRFTAVELDSISGRILRLLYPNADVRVMGFEELNVPDNFYDVAISNIPFGNYPVRDRRYAASGMNRSIHNYFFAKALDKVRPGGIVMFITSRFTMDAQEQQVRQYIASRADLLLAVRLPNTAQEGAGTAVTTDILVLRKREPGEHPAGEPWLESRWVALGDYGAYVNEYFHRNPERILGRQTVGSGLYSGMEYKVEPDGRDLESALREAFEQALPWDVLAKPEHPATEDVPAPVLVPTSVHLKPGAYDLIDGRLVYHDPDTGEVVEADVKGKVRQRITDFIGLKKALLAYYQAQLTDAPEKEIENLRRRYEKAYDAFVEKWGPLHGTGNSRYLSGDPDYYVALATEEWDAEKQQASKGPAFRERTLHPPKWPDRADSSLDALMIVLAKTGQVDMHEVARLVGKTVEEAAQDLEGVVFRDPDGGWKTRDEYLSGNVRDKLRRAEIEAANDPRYRVNVEALRQVQPPHVPFEQIGLNINTPWIPADIMAEFISRVTRIPRDRIDVTFSPLAGGWVLEVDVRRKRDYDNPYNTSKKHAIDLIRDLFMGRKTTVYTTDPATGKRVIDPDETALARERQEAIVAEFHRWLREDAPAYAKEIERIYNEEINVYQRPQYDGSHLTLPGSNPSMKLRPYQKNVVWRIIRGGNTLIAHPVGAGKTFEMIAAAMELKRLGVIRKPMFVVPNHLVEQFARDFRRLYPAANVLVIRTQDAEKGKLAHSVAKIAAGNWDAVIIRQSSFTKIPPSYDTQRQFYQELLKEVEDYILSIAHEKGRDSRIIKELVKVQESLRERLDRLEQQAKRNELLVTFEQTGVDALFVDEAHAYKNLFYYSRLRNVKGLGSRDGSGRAFDMLMKVRYLQRLNGGRGVVFATGTPVSNSLVELYTMFRYLRPDLLGDTKMAALDPWLFTYGRITTQLEARPDGTYGTAERLTQVLNPAEVIARFHQFADVLPPDAVEAEKPRLKGGKRQVIVSPGNDELRAYIETLAERLDAIRAGGVDPKDDNYLKVNSHARLAAIDLRLVKPKATDDPQSKLNLAVQNIYDIWKRTEKDRLTQVVFLDVGVPKGEGGRRRKAKQQAEAEDEALEGISEEEAARDAETEEERRIRVQLYEDIKAKLVERGVPANEIAFIHDASNDAQKQALFDAVNRGEIRIILGSTGKMGVGTNMQRRLVALHHLDTPWRPADLEQREGRILRPGNMNPEVEIYTYVTKGTFDEYLWQLIESKAAMIWRLMRGEVTESEMADPFSDTMVADASIARALASGKPEVMEHVQVMARLRQLQAARRAWENEVRQAKRDVETLREQIKAQQEALEAAKDDAAHLPDTAGDKFRIVIQGKTYTERKAANEALERAVLENARLGTSAVIGQIGEFDIYYDPAFDETSLRNHGKRTIFLQRKRTTQVLVSIASIEQALRNLPASIEKLEANLRLSERKLKDAEEKASQTRFPGDEEIVRLEIRKRELEEILGGPTDHDIQDADLPIADDESDADSPPVLGMPELPAQAAPTPLPDPAPVRTAPPPSEAAIVARLSELFDVAIRAGRLTLRKARGEYKVKPEVIRVKAANDLRAIGHEIGHHLAYTMGLKPEKYADLESLGEQLYPNADAKKWRQEGLAEFIALYFQNPEEARLQAPVFARDFEEALKANPMIAAAVTEAQAMWQAYFGGTPEARIKAHIVRDMPKPKPWLKPWELAQADWVDALYPIYKAESELTGGELPKEASKRPYILARLALGRFRRAEAWLVGKPMDLHGNPVGPSLKEILEPVRDRIEDFEEYLVVRRAMELMSRKDKKGEPAPIETGMDPEDVKAEFARLDADPVLRQAAEQLDRYQDALLEVLVQSGRLSRDLAEKVRQLNRYYVPFYRVFYESDEGPGGGGRMRWADLPNPIKRIRGSSRPIFSPLASIMRNTIVFHDIAARNMVGAALADLAEKAEGMGWLMEKVPRPNQAVAVNLERLRDALEEAGISEVELDNADLERVALLFYPVDHARGKERKENIAVIYRNGKPEFWQMHPDLYRSVQALEAPPPHWIIRILSIPTRILRAGATLNPEFALRNPVRDTFEAWVLRRYRFTPFVDTIRGLAHVINRDDLYWDWVNSGGAQSTFVSVERDYLNRDLRKMLGKQTKTERAVEIIRSPIAALEALSQAWEEATRVGAYARALQAEGRSREGRARAGFWSREVTIDFGRAGFKGRQLNQIQAFFNAGLQGTARVARAFREDPKTMTLRTIFFVTLPTLALYLLNRDDPAYEELPRWRKDLFWCIRTRNGWLFIPKPHVLGVLFGTIPERFLEYVDERDPKALDELWDTLTRSVLPGDPFSVFDWIPDAFRPWVEVAAGPGGWDSFRDRPVVPQGEQGLAARAQYGPMTSETAKTLGRIFNVSPRKVEHVIYGYGGGLARHVLNMLDVLAGRALEKRTIAELVPGLQAFTQRAYIGSDSMDRFYEELEKLETEYRTLREELRRKGYNPDLARRAMRDYQRLKSLRKVRDRIAELREEQRRVMERPGLSAAERRQVAERYTLQMIDQARRAIGREPLSRGGR